MKIDIETERNIGDIVWIAEWTGDDAKYMPGRARISGIDIKIYDKACLFVNNGADGDDWSRSNVKGFNYIGYRCSKEKVEHELQEYLLKEREIK